MKNKSKQNPKSKRPGWSNEAKTLIESSKTETET